jgi:hypothetical protein
MNPGDLVERTRWMPASVKIASASDRIQAIPIATIRVTVDMSTSR